MRILVSDAAHVPTCLINSSNAFHMHDRECLFSEKVYHMLHFSTTTKNKGQVVLGLVCGTKNIKAKQKPLTFLLTKGMNTHCKE